MQGSTLPCASAAGAGGLLFESQSCVAAAYSSAATGAKATTYYGPNPCTPSASYVAEETFVVGVCASGGGASYSEQVSCNATHLVVIGYLGASCNPSNILYTAADPLGCSNGVLTVCAATPSASPTPSAVPAPGYLSTVSGDAHYPSVPQPLKLMQRRQQAPQGRRTSTP